MNGFFLILCQVCICIKFIVLVEVAIQLTGTAMFMREFQALIDYFRYHAGMILNVYMFSHEEIL